MRARERACNSDDGSGEPGGVWKPLPPPLLLLPLPKMLLLTSAGTTKSPSPPLPALRTDAKLRVTTRPAASSCVGPEGSGHGVLGDEEGDEMGVTSG